MPFSYPPHKSSIGGVNANVIAWICYIASFVLSWFPVVKYFAWAAPFILFLIEKSSGLVRYHAMQAFVLGLSMSVISFVLDLISAFFQIPFFLSGNFFAGLSGALLSLPILLINAAVGILYLVFAIKSIISAVKYQENTIPFVSGIAEKIRGFFYR